jgi:hypothetical protein
MLLSMDTNVSVHSEKIHFGRLFSDITKGGIIGTGTDEMSFVGRQLTFIIPFE